MSNGTSSSNTGAIILSFAIGAAVGFGVAKLTGPGPGPTDACHTKGDHDVEILKDGYPSCPDVVIGGRNTVTWKTNDPQGRLTIHFATPGIFVEQCLGTSGSCSSGPPKISWGTGETQRNVDYSGTYDSGTSSRPIYGRIIIVKP
jgi:hypothetical protein